MKLKLSTKEKNLLLVLMGFVIFAVAYFTFYLDYMDKIEQAETDIALLTPQLEEREMHYANMETYKQDTELAKEYIAETMDMYPQIMYEEDFLGWLLNFEEEIGMDISNVSFDDPIMLTSFDAAINVDGEEERKHIEAWEIATTSVSVQSYAELKNSIDRIYGDRYRTKLNSVIISYNVDEDNLATTMDMSKYYLYYDGAQYVPQYIPSVDIGQPNPFGAP